MNTLVTKAPKRVFEICDLDICPAFISSACQSILTAVWTTRLPFISVDSPAGIAASILLDQFSLLDSNSTPIVRDNGLSMEQVKDEFGDAETLVVDFCSGAGGPVPVLENIVNAARTSRRMKGVKFFMTDLRPHVPAWSAAQLKSKSGNLYYIANKIDATDANLDTILSSQMVQYEADYKDQDKEMHHTKGKETRLFRTFHLSFHHFDDSIAKKVLKSALKESDGFAILELQDRRLFSIMSVAAMVGMFTIVLSGILIWGSFGQIFFTIVLPVIPFVMTWDGVVSCLRVREFDELLELINDISPGDIHLNDEYHIEAINGKSGTERFVERNLTRKDELVASKGDWVFTGGRNKYLSFGGDMTWFVGRKHASNKY